MKVDKKIEDIKEYILNLEQVNNELKAKIRILQAINKKLQEENIEFILKLDNADIYGLTGQVYKLNEKQLKYLSDNCQL